MSWVERNPKLIESLRTFISEFQDKQPFVFNFFLPQTSKTLFPLQPESDRGTALLLCFCALHQNITEKRLVQLLGYLWDEYGTDFFKLNRMPFQALQDRLKAFPGLEEWELLPKVPGILRSVCDFFYKHGPILSWVQKMGDAEACVHVLAEEIFLMGKTSQFKSKARYFMWLLTQLPGSQPERFWTDGTLLPITTGQIRLLRDFGPLKNKRHSPWTTPYEKLVYCNRFYQLLCPGRTWMVYTPFDAYLKPVESVPMPNPLSPAKVWMCRQMLGGCLQCILAADCKGREEV